MGKPYTTREIKQIIDMWADGIAVRDISALIGRGGNSVRGIIYRQRVQHGDCAVPHAVDRGWDADAFACLVDLWHEGYTVRAIAKRLGKQPEDVYARICTDRRKNRSNSKFAKRR